MLHILLLFLKIIGIILAVILGIVILLACIVLFVPVRYEAVGKCGGDLKSLKGRVCVTWLFRLIRLDVHYKEQKLRWRIRILWIKKTGGQIKEESHNEESNTKGTYDEKTEFKEAEKLPESKEEIPETGGEIAEKSETCEKEREESVEEIPQAESGDNEASAKDKESPEASEERTGIFQKIRSFTQSILEKIKGLFRKIQELFSGIRDKVYSLEEKKDKILGFLKDETHIGAVKKGKKEVFKLLRRLRPKKLFIEARFGFEDPCITGKTLAGLSILYPFIGEHVELTPDFKKRILKGKLYTKGNVCAFHFLILLWNLFWSRNVRQTYRDVKNFEW